MECDSLKSRRLPAFMVWMCLAAYLPAAAPGTAASPMFCVGTNGRVAVETGGESHCKRVPVSDGHACCSHTHESVQFQDTRCHCGPCIDIAVPLDQSIVEISDVSFNPVTAPLAVHAEISVPDPFSGESGVRSVPPESRDVLSSLRTVVLLI